MRSLIFEREASFPSTTNRGKPLLVIFWAHIFRWAIAPQSLGFDRALNRALCSGKRSSDVEALVSAMEFNRLSDATSKLGCLCWLNTGDACDAG